MNGKQFTAGMLFAFVLLTLVFIPIAHQMGSTTYDPWLDYNEDGKIDTDELYNVGASYSSAGNPTKNVTIAGHASKAMQVVIGGSIPVAESWYSGTISVKNYSKVTILIHMDQMGQNLNYFYLFAGDNSMTAWWQVDVVQNFGYNLVKTYDVMNEVIQIILINNSSESADINVGVYLMA